MISKESLVSDVAIEDSVPVPNWEADLLDHLEHPDHPIDYVTAAVAMK